MQKVSFLILFTSLLLFAGCNSNSQNKHEAGQTSQDGEKNSPHHIKKYNHQKPITNISFGSCSHYDRPQPMWQPVLANNPDLWIWLGDIVYADTEDMDLMAKKYRGQKENGQYQELMTQIPVLGTWDDHDYGQNNAGKYYPKKEESQELLLDFLDVPEDDPRRKRDGVYGSYTYGPSGKQVKVILLDTRFFRDSLHNGENGIIPRKNADILGEKQWGWLEKELNTSNAAVNIIASSIQVISNEHTSEKWGNFPTARKRLFDLVASTDAKGVIFISGDRHKAEISKYEHPGVDYPLYDITSSGLTHSGEVQEPNPRRVGELVLDLNFGVIQFDWDKNPLEVRFLIKGKNNETFVSHQVHY